MTKTPKNIAPKLTKKQAVLSKQIPRCEGRKEEIQNVENDLLSHPLTLFPHLTEGLQPELVKDITNIIEGGDESVDTLSEIAKFPTTPKNYFKTTRNSHIKFVISNEKDNEKDETESNSETSRPEVNYEWLLREEDKEINETTEREREDEESNKRLDEVTREFADWANSLSDSTANIEPSTIKALFASGYEMKPALTVPIQVYELPTLPHELKIETGDVKETVEKEKKVKEVESEQIIEQKKKYGVWYIKPEDWNSNYSKPAVNENQRIIENSIAQNNLAQKYGKGWNPSISNKSRVEDPNIEALKDIANKYRGKEKAPDYADNPDLEESQDLNKELAMLHSSKAFLDYLAGKPELKTPQFMQEIMNANEELLLENH